MFKISIPGHGNISIEHMVFDFNGTIAVDGKLIDGIKDKLIALSQNVAIHIITADTFNSVANEIQGLECNLHILKKGNQKEQKLEYIRSLNAGNVVAFGNGNNDELMLKESAIGISVINSECAAVKAVLASDIVSASIFDAMDLFIKNLRLKATLRS